MRIGLAVRRLSPRGGLESNVLALARYLVDRGHALTVVCQRVEEGGEVDARIVRVGAPGVLGNTAKIVFFARRAAAALARAGTDVSLTSSHVAGPTVVRLESGLIADHRDAMSRRAPWPRGLGVTLDPSERAAEVIERRKIARARLVLTLSEETAASVRLRHRVEAARVRVVRNGVDLRRFVPPSEAERARARAQHGVTGFVVAFVGSGFARKGLGPLIAALAHPGAPAATTLLVAGRDGRAGAYRRQAQLAGVDVRLLGPVPDVGPILAAADALALPSFYDPFGLVALEALATGLPVVIGRAAGASEIVPHPELVVEHPQDTARLAAALAAARVRAGDPATRRVARRAAEAHPLEASLAAIEAALLEAAQP
jgi:UDP-glucose:(heptosyl)LPS alpha-1,3-glucosyltransferase